MYKLGRKVVKGPFMWLHSLELSGEITPDSPISLFANFNHTIGRMQNTKGRYLCLFGGMVCYLQIAYGFPPWSHCLCRMVEKYLNSFHRTSSFICTFLFQLLPCTITWKYWCENMSFSFEQLFSTGLCQCHSAMDLQCSTWKFSVVFLVN